MLEIFTKLLAVDFGPLNPFPEDFDIYDLFTLVIRYGTVLSGLIAIAFIVYGGYQYIMAAGNPDGTKKATSTLTWSIIGLVLILSANLIISYILRTIRES